MSVTISDVAKQAGMSVSTVSQALNNKGRISPPTKDRVRRAAMELGYIPDSRARSMRSSRSHAVGLLVPDIRNPYFSELVYAVQDQLYSAGYAPLIGVSSCQASRQEDYYRILLSRHMDGVLVVPDGPTSPMLRTMLAREFPVVFVDRPDRTLPGVPLVDSDPVPGLEAALEALVARGCRRVAFVPGPESRSYTFREREQAFLAGVDACQGLTGLVVRQGFEDRPRAAATMRHLLGQGVDAVIFGYSADAIKAVAMEWDGDQRSRVPLVSFDDLEVFQLISPQVSVISQQVDRMGRQGVDMLLSMIEPGRQSPEGMSVDRRLRTQTLFVPRGLLT
ncbi:LacI family DNA-binding transcriptional regulator [Bifidobacterium sp. B4079]|uniref:LacI family DNA-binding transcriptional regulator n=1 Tax=Bifidobacterium sp. B4079 TaxID=2817960 RepID=UPI00226B7AE1|nr:LacI family DNA-binding transcriptional regulator [Bifidobacterium sp. B4079]